MYSKNILLIKTCAHQILLFSFTETGFDYYSRPWFLSTRIISNYPNAHKMEIKIKTIAPTW